METRIGTVIVLVDESADIQKLNAIISAHAEIILGRQGIPLKDRQISIISLVLEGDTDRIGSLTGKLGMLSGVRVKSALAG